MFNLNTNYLLPKILNNILPDSIYKPKYLKDFIIVSMLRNFIVDKTDSTQENTIIMNKYLVTKAIDTNNLTVKTNKTYKNPSQSQAYEYKCEIYKIVLHINNSFNPTNISLLSNKNQIHIYQLEGDQTLHVNLNLYTFFNILASESDTVKIKKSRKEYGLPNSKLNSVISQLIVGNPITYYEKDSSNNWIEANLYEINETDQTFGSGYYFHSETETFWKFEFSDILIFYHNLWWSSILMMFNLYNLPVWRGKSDIDKNTNKFRLKANILQLLGGFSKINLLENVQKSLNNHYTVAESSYDYIRKFEKELVQLKDSSNQNSDYFISSIDNLFTKSCDYIYLTNDTVKKVSQIIIAKQLDLATVDSIESDFIISSNDIPKLNKNFIKVNFTQNDHVNLNDSFNEFLANYKFNIFLIYLLTLELIISIIYKNIKLNLNMKTQNKNYLNKLENILLMAILNYFRLINEFNSIIETKALQLELPDNFPNPFLDRAETCYCDHINNKTNSFKLLFSGKTIESNLYSLPDLKTFCQYSCKNSNNLKSNIISDNISQINNSANTFNFNNPKREFSTSSINKVSLEAKENNNILEDMKDNSKIKNKNINYSKSIFSILEKIRELTKNKNYDPKIVQLKIENFWSDILKEKYNENIYNSIKDIQPKIYEIFVTKDPNALKTVFPDLYLFLDDIKIYLITYSVITTYFRRASRTAICSLVADQILFYIYQT